jgi:hypothetical protein
MSTVAEAASNQCTCLYCYAKFSRQATESRYNFRPRLRSGGGKVEIARMFDNLLGIYKFTRLQPHSYVKSGFYLLQNARIVQMWHHLPHHTDSLVIK